MSDDPGTVRNAPAAPAAVFSQPRRASAAAPAAWPADQVVDSLVDRKTGLPADGLTIGTEM